MGARGGPLGGISEVLRTPCGSREGVNHLYPGRDSQGEAVCSYREKAGGQPGLAPSRTGCGSAACLLGDGAVCSYRPIVDYIDAQFENYLQEELKIRRSLFDYHDTRVHVCLYFITPTGHSLKSLDLVTMKKLDSKVCTSHPNLFHGLHGPPLR